MTTDGEKYGIEVRTSGPGANARHELIRETMAETFRRIFALARQLHNDPSANTTDLESVMERVELHARLQGLVMQFGEMLRSHEPLSPSSSHPIWSPSPGVHALHDLIYTWVGDFPALPEEEDNDRTWELFFAAVEAAESKSDTLRERLEELNRHTPKLAAKGEWSWRVFYYAAKVAPEYRRWFSHLEGEVQLPRI